MNVRIPKDRIGQVELMLRCDCGELHVASFCYFDDDRDFATLNVTLRSTRPWYKRWWSAFKYAFGIHDRWMYDEMVLTDEDVRGIIDFLADYLHQPGGEQHETDVPREG